MFRIITSALLGPVRIWKQHARLPRLLRVYWLVPLSILLIAFLGLTFSLPPGPLCDEGMVLFMEGGCDWGNSNIFFFSKLGLLIAVNFSFALFCRRPQASPGAFVPHFLVAAYLAGAFWTDSVCADYYSHPNGSLGQMVLEVSAFAALGIVLAKAFQPRGLLQIAAALLAWNALHITVFYCWLALYDHWLWHHTIALCLTLLGIAAFTHFFLPRIRKPTGTPATDDTTGGAIGSLSL